MTIEKLKSGNYRIKQMVNGKYYSVMCDHKPTKREAESLLNDHMASKFVYIGSFAEYASKYIAIKENVISPCTVRCYNGILKNISDDFKKLQLMKISQEDIQAEINQFAASHAPKSVRNLSGFISAVIKMYRPGMAISTSLPQKVRYDYYVPTPEDIGKILDAARGTEFEIMLRLGCYGLRRSEALSITSASLSGNELMINSAIVINDKNEFVQKTTKTELSTRNIFIDDELADMIRKKGCAYTGHPNNIIKALHRYQDACSVPRFRYHDLRHFFVTELSEANMSDENIMYLGGYSSDYVMKEYYRHARADKNAEIRKQAQQIIQKLSVDNRG